MSSVNAHFQMTLYIIKKVLHKLVESVPSRGTLTLKVKEDILHAKTLIKNIARKSFFPRLLDAIVGQ